MKRQISLRLFITLTFIALIIVFMVCYSVLSTHFHIRQLHHVTHSNMEKAAQIYLKVIPEKKHNQLIEFGEYLITGNWDLLPDEIRDHFPASGEMESFLVKGEKHRWFGPPKALYFLYRFSDHGQDYFMTKTVTRPAHHSNIGKSAKDSRKLFFILTVLILCFLAFTTLLIVKRVFRPISALNRWTRSLDTSSLSKPPPDFSYPELNELAGLIRTSLSSVQESLAREHRFLRYASHELRTPIAVIQNNIELLQKLEEKDDLKHQEMKRKVMERIGRAGSNMQHLTETLLWLSKKEIGSLHSTEIELAPLISEITGEMRYLLERKKVRLTVTTSACNITVPLFPLRIILANLIRNAFQHTWEGEIIIEQREHRIVVANTRTEACSGESELGFGLGLQLTAQLAAKLDWPYSNEMRQGMNRATLHIGPIPPSAAQM